MSNEHLKSSHQKSVERFHELAGDPAPAVPTEPSAKVRVLRAKIILEEALETIRDGLGVELYHWDMVTGSKRPASFEGLILECNAPFSMVETIDGCCDLRYVTTGTLSACGVPDRPFQDAVDRNNLDKFGPGHSLREDGKLIKPPGHQPPDIAGILEHLTADWRGAIGCSPAPEGAPPPEERIRKPRDEQGE